ncbi:unnamed protein product [Bursaphelenchus okinawaensis]|uniref:Protein transport protein sec16 n=1 Tax=Bursaphelenchus okinawaensis TaxID=465554 RepID=A0A811LNS2_9BILA|nr:unnamed protein product [Bursaphelenchus okinawaensis]CAG9124935.1 unnamed protein product [Bursaphelenchus okinawaensis]
MAGFGEDFVHSSRRNRHRRNDYSYAAPRVARPNSELGEPMRHYQPSRPNSAFRYPSGRGQAFEETRETSSSEEFEHAGGNYTMDRRYIPVTRASGSRRVLPVQQEFQTFTDMDIYYCTKVNLKPDLITRFVEECEPPEDFWDMRPVEKAAYLYYYNCYRRYIPDVRKFVKVFNKEFYSLTCRDISDEEALVTICQMTLREYKAQREKQAAIRQQLEERSTIESQNSEHPSFSNVDSDEISSDVNSKEAKKFNSHHPILKFGVGGRIIKLNPKVMTNSFELKTVKSLIRDQFELKNVELLEQFQGPLSVASTQSQSVLLFIRRQLTNIMDSDIYIGNPYSSDTNDCILVWRLLEMVVKQQGRVTGADLAELLCKDQIFPKRALRAQKSVQSDEGTLLGSQESLRNERSVPSDALEDFTNYLLGGHVDEAIKCAENSGLLFDAFVLAYRMYSEGNKQKMESILQRLLAANRSPHHPAMTLYSVAASQPVPLLMHSDADDGKGWRAHIAIVLANLKTDAAIDSIYQLGKTLAAKEFNSAADFCFLAANLLADRDCFSPVTDTEQVSRQHIDLIKATLPDDHVYSQYTRYGWSILDFCATEIYEYAMRLKYNNQPTPLTRSTTFQRRRLEYAQLLNEYGGAAPNVSSYCTSIAQNVWENMYGLDQAFVADLCGLADALRVIGCQSQAETEWIETMKNCYVQHYLQNPQVQPPPEQPYHHVAQESQAPELQKTAEVIENHAEAHARHEVHHHGQTQELHQHGGYQQIQGAYQQTQGGYQNEQRQEVPQQRQALPEQSYAPSQQARRPDSVLSQISSNSAFSVPKKYQTGSTVSTNNRTSSSHRSVSETSVSSDVSESTTTSDRQNATPEAHGPLTSSTPVPPPHVSTQPQYHEQNQHKTSIQNIYQQATPTPVTPVPASPAHSTQGYGNYNQQKFDYNQSNYGQQKQSYDYSQQQGYNAHEGYNQANQGYGIENNQGYGTQAAQGHGNQATDYSDQAVNYGSQAGQYGQSYGQQYQGYDGYGQQSHQGQNQRKQSIQSQQAVNTQVQGHNAQQNHNQMAQTHNTQSVPNQIAPQSQPIQAQKVQQETQNQSKDQKKDDKNAKSGGLFGGLKSKLISIIPSTSEMKLPDDSNPTIRWDEKLGRYVGDGVEEEVAPPPPPSMGMVNTMANTNAAGNTTSTTTTQPQTAAVAPMTVPTVPAAQSATNPMFGGVPQHPVAAVPARSRLQKGSRGMAIAPNGFATAPATAAPMNMVPMVPTAAPAMSGFGFIPQATDDDESSPFASPFQQTDPSAQPQQQ